MADSSQSWWKLTFLQKKKSHTKVLYEISAESVSNSAACVSGAPPHTEEATQDPRLDSRLEKIMDRTTVSKGRHVKVSHSGRFKEKKKVRATLTDNPEMFPGDESSRDENQRARK